MLVRRLVNDFFMLIILVDISFKITGYHATPKFLSFGLDVIKVHLEFSLPKALIMTWRNIALKL